MTAKEIVIYAPMASCLKEELRIIPKTAYIIVPTKKTAAFAP